MQLSFFQKICSYFFPVKVRKSSSEVNPVLELFYYKGQWQLATKDAIYSDGDRYRPLGLAFEKINDRLPAVRNVLVLGTGLGSAVNILDKMGFHPEMDLVEIDATVVDWAKELLPIPSLKRIHFHNADAGHFIEKNKKQYDLIVVDVFESRDVPTFITERSFLENCKSSLSQKGILVLNYIVSDKDNWKVFQQLFSELLSETKVYELGVNRVMVGFLEQ